MPKIAVTRTIHSLPGKRQQYLEHLQHTDQVRRQWGMVESFVMEKAIDPHVVFVMQIWESEERYQTWRASTERARITSEGRGLRVREPSVLYRVLQET